MLKRKDVLIGELRHHLITLAAYMDLPERTKLSEKFARIAVQECVRSLHVAPAEIERRKKDIGIKEEDR